MDENILGKNIKYMRTQNGETLRELGYSLNLERSTVSGYESGDREPNLDSLKKLAKHFGITVDEILSYKFYELEKIDSKQIVDIDEMYDVIFQMLPLVESKEACENSSFLKGVTIIKDIIRAFRDGEIVEGTVFNAAVDYFDEASETGVNEAAANMLWCIFFLWWQQYTDIETMLKFEARLIAKQVDWKEMIYESQKYEKQSSGMRRTFIDDCDELLNDLIKTLKKNEQWAPLGDYYLALRYIVGMINTEYSNEMNQVIGRQMMSSYALLGNKYALDYLNIDVAKK